MLSSSKGVIYMTDDALYAYKVSGRSIFLKEMFDWDSQDIESNLTKLIKSSFSSVVVLNDTVDQHYRKERVPKVGVMDATSVVKRRLAMAFSEYPIRTFKEVQDDTGNKSNERSMKHYLFCACPDNSNIRIVINSIRDSGVGFQGLSLLPMESEGAVAKLAEIFHKKDAKARGEKLKGKEDTGWTVFVGQNASGGLRQVVVKNGVLALTRISPIVETDADINLWCNEVKGEVDSTLGYLSRFGYKSGDMLRVIVVASNLAGDVFDKIMDFDGQFEVLTSQQAVKMLGLPMMNNQPDHIANGLHVGWVSKRLTLANPMASGMIDSIVKPRMAATAAAAALVLSLVGSMYFFSEAVVSYNQHMRNLDVVETQKRQIDTVYNREVERKEALGIDVKLIQNSFLIHEELELEVFDPLEIFEGVARSMEGSMKLDSILIEKGEDPIDEYGNPIVRQEGEAVVVPSKTTLKFSFPGDVDIQKGNASVLAFSKRIRSYLDGAEVEVLQVLKDVSYTGELETQIGINTEAISQDDLNAEIVIKLGGAP